MVTLTAEVAEAEPALTGGPAKFMKWLKSRFPYGASTLIQSVILFILTPSEHF